MKAKRVKGLDPAGSLAENAARLVRVRVDELTSFAPRALEPSRSRAQHDMRIAAKRLRYVLEVTGFCFGPPADAARRRARDLQELLGGLHDCDVMLPRIEAQIAELRRVDVQHVRQRAGAAEDLDPKLSASAPGRTSYRGLEVLAVHVSARRALLFDRFATFWAEQDQAGAWKRLDRAAQRVLDEAARSRAPRTVERAA